MSESLKIYLIKFNRDDEHENIIDENALSINFKSSNINNNSDNKYENIYIPYLDNRSLVSKYDLVKESEIIARNLEQRAKEINSKSILLISPANPYIFFKIKNINQICLEFHKSLLDYYNEFFSKESLKVNQIIISKVEEIKEFLQEELSSEENNRLFIIFQPDKKQISDLLQYIPEKELELYTNKVLKTLDQYNYIENFCISILRRKVININTAKRFSKQWVKNFLYNSTKYVSNIGVSLLINLLENLIPCVIVGAGSSVDENIELLKKLSEVAIIIAVDTAVIPLIKADIKIDIIVSSDSQSINALYITRSKYINDWKNKDTSLYDFPLLVVMPTVHPGLISKWKGKIVFSSIPFDFIKDIDSKTVKKMEIGSGGTVSALAFELSILLNPSEIFLLGTDFCYSKGKLHCNNALFDTFFYSRINYLSTYTSFVSKAMLKANSFIVVNENNIKVRTDPKFLMFLDWFKTQINSSCENKKIFYLSKNSYGLESLVFFERSSIDDFIKENGEHIPDAKIKKRRKIEVLKKLYSFNFESSDSNIILSNYKEYISRIKIEGISAKSMIESVLKRLENEEDTKTENISRYLSFLEKNLLNFTYLKTLITMSFQNYLLEIQFEGKSLDTISFYKSFLKQLEETLKLIEKIF